MAETLTVVADPAARRKTQMRSLETQRRILDAAAKEFAQKGFEGGSTRSIAAAAGLKHPLVTYHFKTKEGLWRAVLADLNERFDDRFSARLAGLRGVDDFTTLRLILEEFIYFSHEHREFHWLMSNAAQDPTSRLEWLCQEYVAPTIRRVTALIDAVQQQGRFAPGDPAHMFYLFIGAVTRIYMVAPELKIVTGRSIEEPGFLERHVQLCLSLFFREPLHAPAGRPSALLRQDGSL